MSTSCSAPRALRNCAPSAPWSGASVRPLNFTVRRPLMMPCRLVLASWVSTLLSRCRAALRRGYETTSLPHARISLSKLKRCLADMPARSPEALLVPLRSLERKHSEWASQSLQLEANLVGHMAFRATTTSACLRTQEPRRLRTNADGVLARLPPNVALGGVRSCSACLQTRVRCATSAMGVNRMNQRLQTHGQSRGGRGRLTIVGGVRDVPLWSGASGAKKLCALGAKDWRFCAAPQLHR